MTTKELIRVEIERLKRQAEESKMEWVNEGYNQNAFAEDCRISSFDKLLSFLDTLPDESEQPARGYDEAYLNEKIEKASKSWEGVDVDKFMDEIRGREPVTDCHELTEAKEEYLRKARMTPGHEWMTRDIEDAFIAGAEWGADHLRDTPKKVSEDLKEAAENSWVDYEYREDPRGLYSPCYIDGFIAGAEWQKRKMMEGAVEGEVYLYSSYKREATAILVDIQKENLGDKVKIIIVKED